MATTFRPIRNLPLKLKLAWGYTLVFTLLTAFSFVMVYVISEEYRQEEFYQRLKDKMYTTFKILTEVDQIDHDLLRIFDRTTINSLYDEKILIFDATGTLMYTSIDDTKISYPRNLLNKLMKEDVEMHLKDGEYEILALEFKHNNKVYFGLAQANDKFGKSKVDFLRNLLIITFIIATALIALASFTLSKTIIYPITKLAKDIEDITPDNLSMRVEQVQTKDELGILTSKFNELLTRVEGAFKFQNNFIHHVSHELKTPLTIMMTNVESAIGNDNKDAVAQSLQFQKDGLMELAQIINAMLDISRAESGSDRLLTEKIRVDELLFECIEEIGYINPEKQIEFLMDESITNSEVLTVKGNSRMLKMVFFNLIKNAINYSSKEPPVIHLKTDNKNAYISFQNDGEVLNTEDRGLMFTHIFRGQNSRNTKGFGLGLFLVQRIVSLHNGHISYSVTDDGHNCLNIDLPQA